MLVSVVALWENGIKGVEAAMIPRSLELIVSEAPNSLPLFHLLGLPCRENCTPSDFISIAFFLLPDCLCGERGAFLRAPLQLLSPYQVIPLSLLQALALPAGSFSSCWLSMLPDT